jgi:hypothetical protein
VEGILAKAEAEGGGLCYQVKWKGSDEVTWEPAENLAHTPQASEFEARMTMMMNA